MVPGAEALIVSLDDPEPAMRMDGFGRGGGG
jgi:hypothetical protein